MTTKPIYRLPAGDRPAAVRPYVGRVCTVRYSPFRNTDDVRETVGTIVGCAHPDTNGSNAGDLILAPTNPAAGMFVNRGVRWELVAIGLATLVELEELHR